MARFSLVISSLTGCLGFSAKRTSRLVRIPASLPDFYGIGDLNEAVLYVGDMGDGWSATKGALEWLAAQVPPPAANRGVSKRIAGKRR